MGEITAVCLLCYTRIKDDQKLFETHYETHHRRPSTVESSSRYETDGEQWEFLFTDNDQIMVEPNLTQAESTGLLSTDKIDVQLDQNQNETETNATVDSRAEMPNRSDHCDSDVIQQSTAVPTENVEKVSRRRNLETTVMLLSQNVLLKSTIKNLSAERIVRIDNGAQQSSATGKSVNKVISAGEKRQSSGLRYGKTCEQRQNLQSYSYTHGNSQFPSDECEIIYIHPRLLGNHKKLIQSDKSRSIYRCLQCRKFCTFRCRLRHHSSVHLKTKFDWEKSYGNLSNPLNLPPFEAESSE